MSNKPKVLFFDIENTPNLAYVWGKYEQNVLAFKQEWLIMSFSYKWQGEETVKCVAMNDFKDTSSDKHVVKALHAILGEADLVVAHNGDEFDIKRARTRFLYHGLPPLPPLASVDTKKMAKKYFNFNGNGLQDLGIYLKLGKKLKNDGFDTWLGCMAGKKSSWNIMKKYNKQDVTLLEKVYDKLRPWMANHPNLSQLNNRFDCNACGSSRLQKRGLRVTTSTKHQRHQCQDCGAWMSTTLTKVVGGK